MAHAKAPAALRSAGALHRALGGPRFIGRVQSSMPNGGRSLSAVRTAGPVALVACLMALSAFPAMAQKPGARSAPKYNVLFVVDTSISMAREREAVAQTVFNLIRNSLPDKVGPGDRLGVWTFHERVYTARFLPETWTPERGEIIADRVAGYLRTVRFERQSRPAKAIA